MTTFDDRDKAFENKYAHDKEITFKVQARAIKLTARWAAERMGMPEAEAKLYSTQMVETDLATPGDEEVLVKIIDDLAKAGITATPREVREEMDKQLVIARHQMMTE